MPRYSFLIASARENGNSEQLARIAAESLDTSDEQNWLAIRDFPLSPFQDLRHEEGGYKSPTGNERALFDATVDCDHLVFVTPVYWYSVPAPLKLYLYYWSAWMRVDELDFKDRMKGKKLWAISASAGSAEQANPMFESLQLSGKYMAMEWGGHVLGNGSAAGDVMNDEQAIAKAKTLFQR